MPFQRKNRQILLQWCRLSFPELFTAKPVILQGKPASAPRFSCIVTVDPRQVAAIQQLENEIVAESWPEGVPPNLKRALTRGEVARPSDPNLKGQWVISANAKQDSPPQVVERDPNTGTHIALRDRSQIYSGCEAHVHVGLYSSQMSVQSPQINCGLNLVIPTGRHFPRFDNRPDADQILASPPDLAPPPGAEGQFSTPPVGDSAPWEDPAQQQGAAFDPDDPTAW